MTSNIRRSGPSGSALQRGLSAATLVGILLKLVTFEVPHEASAAFLRPPLRRVELLMLLTTNNAESNTRNAAARLFYWEY